MKFLFLILIMISCGKNKKDHFKNMTYTQNMTKEYVNIETEGKLSLNFEMDSSALTKEYKIGQNVNYFKNTLLEKYLASKINKKDTTKIEEVLRTPYRKVLSCLTRSDLVELYIDEVDKKLNKITSTIALELFVGNNTPNISFESISYEIKLINPETLEEISLRKGKNLKLREEKFYFSTYDFLPLLDSPFCFILDVNNLGLKDSGYPFSYEKKNKTLISDKMSNYSLFEREKYSFNLDEVKKDELPIYENDIINFENERYNISAYSFNLLKRITKKENYPLFIENPLQDKINLSTVRGIEIKGFLKKNITLPKNYSTKKSGHCTIPLRNRDRSIPCHCRTDVSYSIRNIDDLKIKEDDHIFLMVNNQKIAPFYQYKNFVEIFFNNFENPSSFNESQISLALENKIQVNQHIRADDHGGPIPGCRTNKTNIINVEATLSLEGEMIFYNL